MIDFARLLRTLTAANVEFVIVGGVAATVHGSSRLTTDLDIAYGRSPGNIVRLADALRPLAPYLRGAPTGLPFKLDHATIQAGLNFTLITSAGPIDLLGDLAGVGGYAEIQGHTVEVTLFGERVRCLDLQTLIRAKRAAGRPKDLEVIAELEALDDGAR